MAVAVRGLAGRPFGLGVLAAAEYMIRFYGHLHEGNSRLEALQLAGRAIKAKYPQPFFWAVFILHGEG